jgi:hypothetical protein
MTILPLVVGFRSKSGSLYKIARNLKCALSADFSVAASSAIVGHAVEVLRVDMGSLLACNLNASLMIRVLGYFLYLNEKLLHWRSGGAGGEVGDFT